MRGGGPHRRVLEGDAPGQTTCTVARGGGRYDYFVTRTVPRRRVGSNGMAPLADALPLLPVDAVPDGSGEIVRGVMCTRGGHGLGDVGAQETFVAQVLAGIVLYFLFFRGRS